MSEPTKATEVFARAQPPARPEEDAPAAKTESTSGTTKSTARSQGASVSRLGVLVLPLIGIVVVVALWSKSPTLALVLVLALVLLPLLLVFLGWLARRRIAARRRQAAYGADHPYPPRGPGSYRSRGRDRSAGPGGFGGLTRRQTRAQRRESAEREPGRLPRRSLADRWRQRGGAHRADTEGSGRATRRQRRHQRADGTAPDGTASSSWRQRRAERRRQRQAQTAPAGSADSAGGSGRSQSRRQRRAERRRQQQDHTYQDERGPTPSGTTRRERRAERRKRRRQRQADQSESRPGSTDSAPAPKSRRPKKSKTPKETKEPKSSSPDSSGDKAATTEKSPPRRSFRQRMRERRAARAARVTPAASGDATARGERRRWWRFKTAPKPDDLLGGTRRRWRRRTRTERDTLKTSPTTDSVEPTKPDRSVPGGWTPTPGVRVPAPFSHGDGSLPRVPVASTATSFSHSARVEVPPVLPTRQPVRQKSKGTTVTAAIDNPYAHMVDQSTPEKAAATLQSAADAARRGASDYEDKATAWRAQAAANEGRKHMVGAVTEFLQRAADADATAELHRGMAAAYDEAVANVGK